MRSQKKIQMPDTLVILFCIAILVAITSYFIPVGKFDVKKIQYSSDGQTYSRNVLVADSFQYKLDSQGNPETSPVKVFATENSQSRGFTNFIYDGITSGSKDGGAVAIIAFLLIIGGSFGVLLKTKLLINQFSE